MRKKRTTPTATNKTRNYVLLNYMHTVKLQNLLQKQQELNKTQRQLTIIHRESRFQVNVTSRRANLPK